MLIFFAVGDAFVILFALLFIGRLIVVLVAVVFFILRRNNKNRAVWQQISAAPGLVMPDPKKLQLVGKYDNCELTMASGARRSGGENSTTEFFT